ncbi:IclR family transcriptional regulator [Azospirillum sp.]|uniref:IclR family transcriptional regulator n=1 Tax=Azospirillum sp. TaxID=34012 RepID=UPI003D7164AC
MRKRDAIPGAADLAPDVAQHEDKDPRFVTALARGLDVLRAFRRGDPPLGNQELAERTGLPKPTISRLTYTLSTLGFLVYDAKAGKYRLGTPVLGLGYTALSGLGARAVARPFMQELADHSKLQVALGARDRISMVYLEICRGDAPVILPLDVGSHIKLGTTAMGRAYLAGLPESQRSALLQHIEEHEGPRWPQVRDGVLAAVEEYRTKGYVTSIGSWKTEVNAVGVPLVPHDGSPVLAFNLGGPAFLADPKRLDDDFGPRLAAMVRRIDAALFNA